MHEQERYVGKKLLCVTTSLCNHQVKIVLRDIESREKIVNKYMNSFFLFCGKIGKIQLNQNITNKFFCAFS